METVVIVVLALYSAIMTYLRATASKTKNTFDDKALAIGEKVEPLVDAVKPKTK